MPGLRIDSAPFRPSLLRNHYTPRSPPIKKRSKKGKKKTRACQSQFDYTGWQAWGAWKRSGQEEQENMDVERNCAALCDWPSQCRWNRVRQEEAVEETCPIPAASEADSPSPKSEPKTTQEEAAVQPNKSADSLISKIGTATQKLTLQWTSMLTPIEEESPLPDMAAIEDFLSSAKTVTEPEGPSVTIPLVASLELIKATGTNHSNVDRGSSVFGFDFGFHRKETEEERVPSLTTGFNHIVASTVGIALSTPFRYRRCVSDPPMQSVPPQEQPARRVSVG
ncbi:MAG: hypothetical protein Q9209_002612 [Squamulea sp. 1 TL-2023]